MSRRARWRQRRPEGQGIAVLVRRALGLTQREMAERLGVSLRSVGRYERGGTIPEPVARLYHEILRQR